MRVVRAPALPSASHSSSDEEFPAGGASADTPITRRGTGHGRLQGHLPGRQCSSRFLGARAVARSGGGGDCGAAYSRRVALPCARSAVAVATALTGAGAACATGPGSASATPPSSGRGGGRGRGGIGGGGGTGGQRRVKGSFAQALPFGGEGEGLEDSAVGRPGQDVLEVPRQRAREPKDLAMPRKIQKGEGEEGRLRFRPIVSRLDTAM